VATVAAAGVSIIDVDADALASSKTGSINPSTTIVDPLSDAKSTALMAVEASELSVSSFIYSVAF